VAGTMTQLTPDAALNLIIPLTAKTDVDSFRSPRVTHISFPNIQYKLFWSSLSSPPNDRSICLPF